MYVTCNIHVTQRSTINPVLLYTCVVRKCTHFCVPVYTLIYSLSDSFSKFLSFCNPTVTTPPSCPCPCFGLQSYHTQHRRTHCTSGTMVPHGNIPCKIVQFCHRSFAQLAATNVFCPNVAGAGRCTILCERTTRRQY